MLIFSFFLSNLMTVTKFSPSLLGVRFLESLFDFNTSHSPLAYQHATTPPQYHQGSTLSCLHYQCFKNNVLTEFKILLNLISNRSV